MMLPILWRDTFGHRNLALLANRIRTKGSEALYEDAPDAILKWYASDKLNEFVYTLFVDGEFAKDGKRTMEFKTPQECMQEWHKRQQLSEAA